MVSFKDHYKLKYCNPKVLFNQINCVLSIISNLVHTTCWCLDCNENPEWCLWLSAGSKHKALNPSVSQSAAVPLRREMWKLTNCVSGCDFTTPLFISTDTLVQSDSKVSLQASFIAISCYFFHTVFFFSLLLLHWFVGLEASSGFFSFSLLFPLHSWTIQTYLTFSSCQSC